MNAQPASHPAAEQLSAFGQGKLHDAAAAAVAEHLAACTRCRQTLESLPGDTRVGMGRTPAEAATVAPSSPAPAPKDRTRNPPQPAAPLAGLPSELAKHEKYRILRELGRGGMGVVYQAEHIQMERLVAIKVINRSILENPQALERFAQEVRAAAKLNHPNIVAAYDFEKVGELHMLVMEFVEGQNLAEIVERKGPLPILNACHSVRQAALGLQHAHEKGMVHRDLKPQNLMLAPKGVVKLLDMGLCGETGEKTDRAGLTGMGATLGTPQYMAPEQAMDAAKADIRSDIYSLGCTLYCLLAGRPPFADGTAMQIILCQLEKEPQPLSELRSDVPAQLAAVVARMMAKDPEQRYQKPIEVAQALAPFCKPGAKSVAVDPVPVAKPVAAAAAGQATPPTAGPVEEVDWALPAFQVPPVRRRPKTERASAAVRSDPLTADGALDSVLPADEEVEDAPSELGSTKKWLIGGGIAAGVAFLAFTFIVVLGLVLLWPSGESKPIANVRTTVPENRPSQPPEPDVPPDVPVDGGTVTVKPQPDTAPPPPKLMDVTVVLEKVPAGAIVSVDGELVTVTSDDGKPVEVQVAPDKKHQVEVKKDGFKDFYTEIKVPARGRKALVVLLERIAPPPIEVPKPRGEDKEVIQEKLVRLFDGKGLDGWKIRNGKMEMWDAGKGILAVEGDQTAICGWLMTEKEYGDFELRLECKVAKMGKAGIALRAPLDGDPAFQGMVVRILDNANYKDKGLKPTQLCGSISEVVPPQKDETKPCDEWSTYRIVAKGRQIMIELNGVPILDKNLDDYMKAFGRNHPGLGREKGHVGLQGLEGHVEFRNIEIKELTAGKEPVKTVAKEPAKTPVKTPPKEPEVLAVLAHHVNGSAAAENRLYSNGHINSPDSNDVWGLAGNVLYLKWRNNNAPGGFWIDICTISKDGKSYVGHNNAKQPAQISGENRSDGDLRKLLQKRGD